MFAAVALAAVLCLMMVLPYLPGRFGASAATLSFVVQVSGYVSLLMVPIGLAWFVSPRRFRLWRRLALVLAALLVVVITVSAVSVNQLAVGVLIGLAAMVFLRTASRSTADAASVAEPKSLIMRFYLTVVPLILIAFRATVLPTAAGWSRDRAIRHAAILVGEIEMYRQRHGHYPLSLQTLHQDVPTGVIGIERFRYEPKGEAYNLYFARPHLELDAQEVVMFNPRDEHRFTSHELDILQFEGERLELRRGDRRRTRLTHPHWISILFD